MPTNRQYLESIAHFTAALLEKTDEELDAAIGRGELAEIDDTLDSILDVCNELGDE